MSNVNERHERDRWKDGIFIGVVVLFTALAIGSVTSKAQGRVIEREWSVTVVDPSNQLILR
jgi:hypothetical protein